MADEIRDAKQNNIYYDAKAPQANGLGARACLVTGIDGRFGRQSMRPVRKQFRIRDRTILSRRGELLFQAAKPFVDFVP